MTTIHVRPGEGQRYRMIDGDHIAKTAVHDDGGAFEVFEVIAPAAPMAPPTSLRGPGCCSCSRVGSLHWSATRPTRWSPGEWW